MMWIITAYLHLQSEDLYFWLVIFLKYNFRVNFKNWSNYLVGSLLGNMCIHSLLRKVLSIHTFCAWEDKKKHNKSVMQKPFSKESRSCTWYAQRHEHGEGAVALKSCMLCHFSCYCATADAGKIASIVCSSFISSQWKAQKYYSPTLCQILFWLLSDLFPVADQK